MWRGKKTNGLLAEEEGKYLVQVGGFRDHVVILSANWSLRECLFLLNWSHRLPCMMILLMALFEALEVGSLSQCFIHPGLGLFGTTSSR